jgi:hypothetical protein
MVRRGTQSRGFFNNVITEIRLLLQQIVSLVSSWITSLPRGTRFLIGTLIVLHVIAFFFFDGTIFSRLFFMPSLILHGEI